MEETDEMCISVQTEGTLCCYREPGLSLGSRRRDDDPAIKEWLTPGCKGRGSCLAGRGDKCTVALRGTSRACSRKAKMVREAGARKARRGVVQEETGELGGQRPFILLATDGASVFISRALTDFDG